MSKPNSAIWYQPYDLGLGFPIAGDASVDAVGEATICGGLNFAIIVFRLLGATKPLIAIEFERPHVIRMLDERELSLETSSKRWKGIDHSFARIVVGGEYPTDKSYLKEWMPKVTHYQFVTGDNCVDVICENAPTANLIRDEDLTDILFRGLFSS